jgi:hypothetical protein
MSDDMNAAGVTGGDDADDALLLELRTLAALHDPVPLDAVAAARSAIAYRTMDAELAELTADTSVEPRVAGVRGAAAPALLSFDAIDLTVELEVVETAGARRLLGQLVPPRPGTVQVRHRGGTSTVTADEVGRFSADHVARGPVSLRCEVEGRVVETDWFLA